MSKLSFVWYHIRLFASVEKIDDVPTKDLQMLCDNIPDVIIAIFHLPESGTSIYIRVPESHSAQVDSIISFGHQKQEYPICTKIESLVEMKLSKKSIYPLVSDPSAVHQDVFSLLSSAPHGAVFLKLAHTDSRKIQRQYDSIKRKYDKQDDAVKKTNWHESACKAKAGCSRFFHTQLFFGTIILHNTDNFERILPCVGKHLEPNGLVRKRSILSDAKKNPLKALNYLKKILVGKAKKSNMILSTDDLLPFIRFPANADRLQMEPAPSDTFASGLSADIPDPQKQFEESLKKIDGKNEENEKNEKENNI